MGKLMHRIVLGLCLCTGIILEHTSHSALPPVALTKAFPKLPLERPIWMSEAPDGSSRMFIVEQAGRIVIAPKNSDGANATEFLNIASRNLQVDNEEGLLSLAFHPQFPSNKLFYVYYNRQNPRRSVISEFKVSATDSNKAELASERILLQVPQPYGNHKGGQIGFGPDGFLYIALGDGGAAHDPHNNGQNMASLLSKMLRIDVNSRSTRREGWQRQQLEYGIPTDNPFHPEPDHYGVCKEIWASGLRNPWRFSWDRQTGHLWLGDVGQDLWEEINLIVKGGNYGWPIREARHHFKPGPLGARFVEPILEYPHRPEMQSQTQFPDHSVGLSITGGYVYRGRKYPALNGIYVYGDYNLGTIWGLRYENGKVSEQGTLLQQPKNIVSFAEDAEGELYVLCFDETIFQLTVPDAK